MTRARDSAVFPAPWNTLYSKPRPGIRFVPCTRSTSNSYQIAEAHNKELVEAITKALVDNPDQVHVRVIEGEQLIVFELRVHSSDVGKVIGRQGHGGCHAHNLECGGNEASKALRIRNP